MRCSKNEEDQEARGITGITVNVQFKKKLLRKNKKPSEKPIEFCFLPRERRDSLTTLTNSARLLASKMLKTPTK